MKEGLEGVRKKSNYAPNPQPPGPIPRFPFQAIKCARHSVPSAALEGHSPYTLKEKGRVSRLDAKLEGVRSTRDSKQSRPTIPDTKAGLGAGDPFLFPPHAPSDLKKKKYSRSGRDRVTGFSEAGSPARAPELKRGWSPPPPPPRRPLPPPIPGADWRALTLEARTRTQESRDPPSARKGPSRPGLGPNRALL